MLDSGQMEQVFVNLLNNAVDAIKSSGAILIEVKKAGDNLSLENEILEEGIIISIEDNGPGIDSDLIGQIFDPFFSSKISAKGTGLGLSITKAIIQRHGGKIEVSSIKGKGTTFNIFLPLIYKEDT